MFAHLLQSGQGFHGLRALRPGGVRKLFGLLRCTVCVQSSRGFALSSTTAPGSAQSRDLWLLLRSQVVTSRCDARSDACDANSYSLDAAI
jgi:hypothetical protein